jgi:hypothetical protein
VLTASNSLYSDGHFQTPLVLAASRADYFNPPLVLPLAIAKDGYFQPPLVLAPHTLWLPPSQMVLPPFRFTLSVLRHFDFVDAESEEKLALGLLVSLFMAKKKTFSDTIATLYEKCLVSNFFLFRQHCPF